MDGIGVKYTGVDKLTLGQVQKTYNSTLLITSTEVTKRATVYFTPETHPDMELAEAVRRSGGFPYIYPPVKEGKRYYIDGGILNNYPIRKLYDYLPKSQVIGSKLYSDDEIDKEEIFPENIFEYTKLLIEMLHEQNLRVHVKKEDWKRTIKVDVGSVTATDFNLCTDKKLALIKAGEDAAKTFFGL